MPQVIRLIGEMNRATLEEQPVSYSVLYRMIIYTHVSDDQSHTDVADAPPSDCYPPSDTLTGHL